MFTNDPGLVGNLNELVQDFFENAKLHYDPQAFGNSADGRFSYIYSALINTKGPDMIKLANLRNHLSEWDRLYSYGGFIRSVAIGQVKPINPPSFADGSDPNNGQIRKANLDATYHPFTIRSEFMTTQFAVQLKAAMSVPDEIGLYLAGVLNALNDGANNTMFRLYKELFYKYWTEMTPDQQAVMSDETLPAAIVDKTTAIQAVTTIRNYITQYLFGKANYNVVNFAHAVAMANQRLYLIDTFANSIVDNLKLDHYMGTGLDYSDIAGSLSAFLGIPVRILDDFGGQIPYDIDGERLYPIFDADGAVTGTYAATDGGTTAVEVDHWGQPEDYSFRALLTEEDWGNVFPINDLVNTQFFLRGGGYTNTSRYTERLCVAKPQSNTVFFK